MQQRRTSLQILQGYFRPERSNRHNLLINPAFRRIRIPSTGKSTDNLQKYPAQKGLTGRKMELRKSPPGLFPKWWRGDLTGGAIQKTPEKAIATKINTGMLRLGGRGQPLPPGVQNNMENFFETDFSDVRIHTGPQAASIGALAFTIGKDIYFTPGLYKPHSRDGLSLLGHELTHVKQQHEGRVTNPFGSGVAVVQDPALEYEAQQMGEAAADAVMTGQAKNKTRKKTGRLISDDETIKLKIRSAPGRIQMSQIFNVRQKTAGPGHRTFTLYKGARPIGGADLVDDKKDTAMIYNLEIDERERGDGGGSALLVAAGSAAARYGKRKIALDADDDGSGRLKSWYMKHGFEPQDSSNEFGMQTMECDPAELAQLKEGFRIP